jgi:hypothetical protein
MEFMWKSFQGKRLPRIDMNEGDVTEEDESSETQRRAAKRSLDRRVPLCKELSALICPFLQSTQLKDLQTVNESRAFFRFERFIGERFGCSVCAEASVQS